MGTAVSLRFGVIGLSAGNGHPYSWSAVFNGYDHAEMLGCGFPMIPQYLALQEWPKVKISGARVTCVWTQSTQVSEKIARAAYIDHIVSCPTEMIGQVDGVLLARDDAENHLSFAAPFLDAGLPVYIDKPLALSMTDLENIYSHEQYAGQIFSCSALKFAQEFRLSDSELENIGQIHEIHAITPKSWDKYAIHIIEPVLGIVGLEDRVEAISRFSVRGTGAGLRVAWESGATTLFSALGDDTKGPIAIRVMGDRGWKDLIFKDSFSCFKLALENFVAGINGSEIRTPRASIEAAIKLVAAGR